MYTDCVKRYKQTYLLCSKPLLDLSSEAKVSIEGCTVESRLYFCSVRPLRYLRLLLLKVVQLEFVVAFGFTKPEG